MTTIMQTDAILMFPVFLTRKKTGRPTKAADPKHTICRLVKLNMTFDFTRDKSRGTFTYIAIYSSSLPSVH